MRNRYLIKEIEQVVHWEGEDEDPDITYDVGIPVASDIEDVISKLKQGCWDNLDIRETEMIAYPADSHQDMRTGDYHQTQMVISGDAYDMECMLNYYFRKVHDGTSDPRI
jgi:hypothetical protein